MTIPSTARKAGPLLGNGATTSFPFTFKVFAASDIAVTIANSLGVETALVLNTDYSVTLNPNQETSPGGTVTYPLSGSPLPVGSRLTIVGDLPYDQPLDLPSGGNYSPLALENQLDRATMQIQQLQENLGRALQVRVTSGADTTLPSPAATNLIGWNAGGTGLENVPITDIGTVVAYGTMRYDILTGDGVTTTFALTANPATIGNLDVAMGGVTQLPVTDYTLAGSNIVFSTAPPNGVKILVRYGEALGVYDGDAQDIRYTPAGTGAVATNVKSKLREFVSVKDFGAVGDGVTDDTAAIVAATNTGKSVLFVSGETYKVNPLNFSGLDIYWSTTGEEQARIYCDTLPDENVARFVGTSIGSTTVATNAFPMQLVVELASTEGIQVGDLLSIRNSTLWQSDPRNTIYEGQLAKVHSISGSSVQLDAALCVGMPAGSVVQIYRPIKVQMRNIRFERLPVTTSSRGVFFQSVVDIRLENCDSQNATRYGFLVQRCYKGQIEGGVFFGSNLITSAQFGYAVTVDSSWNVTVSKVTSKQHRRCVSMGGVAEIPTWYGVVRECTAHGGGFTETGADAWPLGADGGSGMSSHGASAGTIFESNILINTFRGLTLRGRYETARNNLFVGAMLTPIWTRFGGGLLICGNRYTDSYEEGLSTPGTTVGPISDTFRPRSFIEFQIPNSDLDMNVHIHNNTARNVKQSLVYVTGQSFGSINNWIVHDNTVVIDAITPPTFASIISGDSSTFATNFQAWDNTVIAADSVPVLKYRIDMSGGASTSNVLKVSNNTWRVWLPVDTAAQIKVGWVEGQVAIKLFPYSNSNTPRYNGVIRNASTITTDFGNSFGVDVLSTALTGTTGAVGRASVSFFGDSVYLENRTASSVRFTLVVDGAA